jgi:hypothetical protein
MRDDNRVWAKSYRVWVAIECAPTDEYGRLIRVEDTFIDY